MAKLLLPQNVAGRRGLCVEWLSGRRLLAVDTTVTVTTRRRRRRTTSTAAQPRRLSHAVTPQRPLTSTSTRQRSECSPVPLSLFCLPNRRTNPKSGIVYSGTKRTLATIELRCLLVDIDEASHMWLFLTNILSNLTGIICTVHCILLFFKWLIQNLNSSNSCLAKAHNWLAQWMCNIDLYANFVLSLWFGWCSIAFNDGVNLRETVFLIKQTQQLNLGHPRLESINFMKVV